LNRHNIREAEIEINAARGVLDDADELYRALSAEITASQSRLRRRTSDRAGARHHQELRHVSLPRAWPR
jgi:hypothetical protein